MKYQKIYKCTISDGIGVRVSLYVSGCLNHCEGCHNPESWDFNSGEEFADETIDMIIKYMDHDYISGLTICGGEPCEIANQKALITMIRRVKEHFGDSKNIWLYTGYEYEDLLENGKRHCDVTDELLSNIDVAVVGRFILSQLDITDNNRWRGSRNQRVIDVKKSLNNNSVVFLENIPNNQ